jgi:hypothetical protein
MYLPIGSVVLQLKELIFNDQLQHIIKQYIEQETDCALPTVPPSSSWSLQISLPDPVDEAAGCLLTAAV